VAQAAREASKSPAKPPFYACFKTDILAGKSKRTRKGIWRHNLTMTTAASYTNAYDWLAGAMGNGPAFAFATATGAATGSSSTSLTNSGASFPASSASTGGGLTGQIVVCWISTTVMVYGVITSNTSTVLTVDQWYNAASTTGAAGSTPASTAPYIILPGQNPAAWLCLSASVFTPATTDQSLGTQGAELAADGFNRAVGTWAHTHAASSYTLIHTWTAAGTHTINNEGVSGAATILTTPNFGGVFPFESAEPNPPTLVSLDTLQNTITITI
jgi:hypothetical protein